MRCSLRGNCQIALEILLSARGPLLPDGRLQASRITRLQRCRQSAALLLCSASERLPCLYMPDMEGSQACWGGQASETRSDLMGLRLSTYMAAYDLQDTG